MRRFLRTLKEKMTAYEVFIILISAIVGAVFSLISGLNVDVAIYISIGIIAFFLIATILIQWLVDRFNVLRLIKKFNKKKQYNLSIALGTNLSIGLWHTYRLKLRLKIGEQVKIAAKKSLIEATPDKQYELKYILAKTLIDDLGYTNYILNYPEVAYENICEGIEVIDDLLDQLKSPQDKLRFKELKLKALRHAMGMIDRIEHFVGGKTEIEIVREKFNDLFNELISTDGGFNSDASLCAKYAVIKDMFLKSKAEDNKNNAELALQQIEKLKSRIVKLLNSDETKLEDKARYCEWEFKCNRLKWEIELFIEQNIVENYKMLFKKITQPEDKTINRFLDIYKRFLLYSQYIINHIDIADEDAKSHIKTYKTNWGQAKKAAAEFLIGCEAKKQIKEIDDLNKNIKVLLKEKEKDKDNKITTVQ